MPKRYLVLENGRVFEGEGYGAQVETVGELVFTTNMAGYLETLTDPSYYGQIVVMTFPLIGNYGVIPQDFESGSPRLFGFVTREHCAVPSNFRHDNDEGALDAFLLRSGIPAISGIDTRALTRVLRSCGVTRAAIADKPAFEFAEDAPICGVAEVTCACPVVYPAEGERKHSVAVVDYGAKGGIARSLTRRGSDVTVYPASAKAEDILAGKHDGIMLSNGPGDPAQNVSIIEEIKILMKSGVPVFGICLGHQLMALAAGAKTVKLPFGHRGANQPAKHLDSGRVYITSQNHGYAVLPESLPDTARLSWVNMNDGSCEGVKYMNAKAFSVQFHPEACAGPLDTQFLFDEFLELMKN
ncbi:MAG: carbamoyl phosphate synthase small subunit [Oscillospiraceae bacterium]|jgi:carbamoyl-phosphate synthase small subunit|nr:carbamoyl phosphate synthase small subunit [Oscillospiraceae bacterium]